MDTQIRSRDRIKSGRLQQQQYQSAFSDLHPPLNQREATVAASRCYFCYDAPCVTACPTRIDIPLFIRQIATGDVKGSAETILQQNIMGGMCARVCPTETLCEQDCVRETSEGKPVAIGLLQRFATDALLASGKQPFVRAAPTTKRIAVVGAGPAGISCSHRLAMLGHTVTIYEAKAKAGGLNEYGIAAYKTIDNFAQRELEFILSIGGITLQQNKRVGQDVALADLINQYDAIFLATGLQSGNKLGIADEDLSGVIDAIDYIARLRQASDLAALPVGETVAVIGGGMTAIDIAIQIKKLGATTVHILYRGSHQQMKASLYEQQLALNHGVIIHENAVLQQLIGVAGVLQAAKFTTPNGELQLAVDQLFKAIGQSYQEVRGTDQEAPVQTDLAMERGRIKVDSEYRTNLAKVWAGGDCIASGNDLTVTAVEEGKQAALAINRALI